MCAVENKIRSPEGIDENDVSQLTRYRETWESEFPSFRRALRIPVAHWHSPSDGNGARTLDP